MTLAASDTSYNLRPLLVLNSSLFKKYMEVGGLQNSGVRASTKKVSGIYRHKFPELNSHGGWGIGRSSMEVNSFYR